MTGLASIPLRTIDGRETHLAEHDGKVVLVVNVASKCGLTPQYEALEQAYRRHKDEGLVVLGFPCNQFRDQEPGTEADIAAFCSSTYGVTFPMFSRIAVNGPDRHPLYHALLSEAPERTETDGDLRTRLEKHGMVITPDDVMWNFEKFLIDRGGRVVGRFAPDVSIDQPVLANAIAKALAA